MKTIRLQLMAVLMGILALGLTSCNDNNSNPRIISPKEIVGKWQLEKKVINGKKSNEVNLCKTQNDYIEFLDNGTFTEVNYNSDCKASVSTPNVNRNWSISTGNTLTKEFTKKSINSAAKLTENYNIQHLTTNELVLYITKQNREENKVNITQITLHYKK